MGVTLLYWQGAVAADAIYLTFNIYLSILSVQPLNQGRLRRRLSLQAVKVGRGKKKKIKKKNRLSRVLFSASDISSHCHHDLASYSSL